MAKELGLGQVSLVDWISALKAELTRASQQLDIDGPRFSVGTIEMELELTSSREGDKHGEIKFWVVGLGMSSGKASGATQRVKIRLNPEMPGGRKLQVNDQMIQRPD